MPPPVARRRTIPPYVARRQLFGEFLQSYIDRALTSGDDALFDSLRQVAKAMHAAAREVCRAASVPSGRNASAWVARWLLHARMAYHRHDEHSLREALRRIPSWTHLFVDDAGMPVEGVSVERFDAAIRDLWARQAREDLEFDLRGPYELGRTGGWQRWPRMRGRSIASPISEMMRPPRAALRSPPRCWRPLEGDLCGRASEVAGGNAATADVHQPGAGQRSRGAAHLRPLCHNDSTVPSLGAGARRHPVCHLGERRGGRRACPVQGILHDPQRRGHAGVAECIARSFHSERGRRATLRAGMHRRPVASGRSPFPIHARRYWRRRTTSRWRRSPSM